MPDEVLTGSQHTLRQVFPLQSLDVSHPEMADQGWVFPKGFFDTSPTCIAPDIQHRRQCLPCANRQQLFADGGGHRFSQFRLEGGRQSQHLRVHCAPQHHCPTAAFFVEDGWNPQASVFSQELLQFVGSPGCRNRIERRCASKARDLPNAVF